MLNDKRLIRFKSEKQTDSIKFKDNEIWRSEIMSWFNELTIISFQEILLL